MLIAPLDGVVSVATCSSFVLSLFRVVGMLPGLRQRFLTINCEPGSATLVLALLCRRRARRKAGAVVNARSRAEKTTRPIPFARARHAGVRCGYANAPTRRAVHLGGSEPPPFCFAMPFCGTLDMRFATTLHFWT